MVRILLKYYLKHDLKEAVLASWSVRKAKTQAVSWFWWGAGANTAGSSSSSPGPKGWHEAPAQQHLSLSLCSVKLLGLLQWWWHMVWWGAEKGPWAVGDGGQSTWTGEASGHLLVESACGQPDMVRFVHGLQKQYILRAAVKFLRGKIPNFGDFKKSLSLQSDFSCLLLMESQSPALQVKFVSTHLTWVAADQLERSLTTCLGSSRGIAKAKGGSCSVITLYLELSSCFCLAGEECDFSILTRWAWLSLFGVVRNATGENSVKRGKRKDTRLS